MRKVNIRRESKLMRTYSAKAGEVEKKWYLVDAEGEVLGRLASQVAIILRGKHKPQFTPHMDTGDYIVVVNASKVRLSGRKADQKYYFHHTGYPKGERIIPFQRLVQEKPERIVKSAVWGMLPHNRLGRKVIKKLHIYSGPEHPHQAQKPEKLEL